MKGFSLLRADLSLAPFMTTIHNIEVQATIDFYSMPRNIEVNFFKFLVVITIM